MAGGPRSRPGGSIPDPGEGGFGGGPGAPEPYTNIYIYIYIYIYLSVDVHYVWYVRNPGIVTYSEAGYVQVAGTPGIRGALYVVQ